MGKTKGLNGKRGTCEGFEAVVVVETSLNNSQAWLNHGQILEAATSTGTAKQLAERFSGDPSKCGPQAFRAARGVHQSEGRAAIAIRAKAVCAAAVSHRARLFVGSKVPCQYHEKKISAKPSYHGLQASQTAVVGGDALCSSIAAAYRLDDMIKDEITGRRQAGAGRFLTWGVVATLLCVLMPAMARAAGIEANTGLLSPPTVDNKPVNVKVGLFLTNLIDVDEVKEMFHISGYLFMTWKDPRLAFSPAGSDTDRSYNPDSIWVPRVFMVNAVVQREKTNINISGNPDGTIHYLELFNAELTTSFYLEPFPFDTESLEMFVEPFLDERNTMTLEYDKQVGGVGTEPFVELAQWKILRIRGTGQRHAIGSTGKEISELKSTWSFSAATGTTFGKCFCLCLRSSRLRIRPSG